MTEEKEKNEAQAAGQSKQGEFGIQKVYVKDLSFETPNSPAIFKEEWKPAVNMDLANSAEPLDKNVFEATLSVTVTVSSGDKTMYLAEVQQSGIFTIAGFPQDVVKRMLATVCPNILFPFAREVVSDLVTRGGFPQLLLAPVNFDALYIQHQQKLAEQAAQKETKH